MRYRVLGPVQVVDDTGRDRTPAGPLQRRLMAALVLHGGRVISADRLAELLWADDLTGDRAGALQTHVFRLRRSLPEGALTHQPPGYRLEIGGAEIDAERFAAAVAEAASIRDGDPGRSVALLDEALGWWRGAPYEELSDADEGRIEATRLNELRLRAVEERFEALLALGRHAEAMPDLDAHAAHHPLRERPQALLMTALHRAGRTADALRAYDAYRRHLAEELGLDPSPALARLQDEIILGRADHAPPSIARDAAPPAVPQTEPAPLPESATSFVGREDLLADLARRLDDERVVTLIGTAGVGKTRAAIEAARRATERFPDGTWYCDLSGADADSTPLIVAAALAVEERAGVDLNARIADVLRHRRALIVLDNCEHVLDAVARLVECVIAGAPQVTILATSRERLAVDGEHLCPVAPFAVPPDTGDGGPAVRLFAERARAVQPGFAVDDTNRVLVSRICSRLDGLPLAIELAASRLQTMQLDEVAAGLDRRFRLLTGGRRTTGRHRSLSAAVDWSYAQLDAASSRAFARLSVFAGPFSAASAAALCGTDEADALDLLQGLTERSLLHRVGHRYAMLETLRQYGAQRLEVDGATAEVRGAHAAHHVELVEALSARLHSDTGTSVLDTVDDVLPDIRMAFRFLVSCGDVDGAIRMVLALHDYGLFRMRPEVLGWGEEAAELAGAADHPGTPEALSNASVGAWKRGDLAAAEAFIDRAFALAAEQGRAPTPTMFTQRGTVELVEGRLDTARLAYQLAIQGESPGDVVRRTVAQATALLAAAYQGDPSAPAEAEALLAELGADGDLPHVAYAWYVAGETMVETDPELAQRRLRRAFDAATASGAWFVSGVAGASYTSLEARYGDPKTAVEGYRWLLDHFDRSGIVSLRWTALRSVAELLARMGRDEAAAKLLGAIRATAGGHEVFGRDEERLTRIGEQLRARLGSEAYERALAAGAGLDDGDASALALRAFDEDTAAA